MYYKYMAWIELEAKQDNFKVWNWNSSLINFLLSDKGESWKGDLSNLWELVQTRIANSIFLGQAEVKSQIESFFFFPFFLPVDSGNCPACLNYPLSPKWDTWGWVPSCQQLLLKKRNKPSCIPASESKYFRATVSLFKRSIWSWKALPYTPGPKNCQKNIFFLWAKTIKMVNKSPQMTPSDMPRPEQSTLCAIYNLYYFPLT